MKDLHRLYYIPGAFFLLATVLDLLGLLFEIPIHEVIKGSLMALLCATTLAYAVPRKADARALAMLAGAQLLGLTGDLLLQGSGFALFVSGMVAFLAGPHARHLTGQVLLYSNLLGGLSWKGLGWKVWVPALAVMAALVLLLVHVIGVSGALFVPMLVYGFVLMLLIFSALCGVVRLGGAVWWMLLAGAVLFTGSDAMIAVRKFGGPDTSLMDFAVMATYLAAQVLLACGIVELICKSDD